MNYICHKCGKGFKFKSKLDEHNKRKKPCSTQQNVLKNQQNVLKKQQNILDENQRNIPDENQRNIPQEKQQNTCTDCGKVFQWNWLLQRHKPSCRGCNRLDCMYCGKTFSTPKTRWSHEKNRTVHCLTKENEMLKDKFKGTRDVRKGTKDVKNEPPGTINIININNISNSIVSMTSYKDETYDKLDTELIMKAVEGIHEEDWSKRLFKITNEYHKNIPNLKITNLRGNAALEWDDNIKKYISVPQKAAVEECFTKMVPKIEQASQDIRIKDDMRPTVYCITCCIDGGVDADEEEALKWKKKAIEHVKLGLYQSGSQPESTSGALGVLK